jgi:hypothetical protein
MGTYNILEHEWTKVLVEAHEDIAIGHYEGKYTT